MPLAVHDERLTRRVGAAVLVAAALTVVFVVMVLPRLGSDGVTVRVRFGVVVGLPEGAAVRVAGKDIGHVESIGVARDPRNPRGQVGVVAVVRIDPAWAARIPLNSDFFVDARSMLAPRYIAIGPPVALPGRPLRDGDEVTGIDPPSLDNVLQRTWENLEEVRRFLDAIRPPIANMKRSAARLTGTIDSLDPRPGADRAS
ncbi:MAG: MCE family protein, partial [Deltaproteobacteria bacterium]|nr:MCE family protein [Kofleriaceae bacterium]